MKFRFTKNGQRLRNINARALQLIWIVLAIVPLLIYDYVARGCHENQLIYFTNDEVQLSELLCMTNHFIHFSRGILAIFCNS